jgi:predicted alpha/beta superfamily hydrolase
MKEYRVLKFYAEALKKEKRVYLYLPNDYETTNASYPVLYMHDGHNLFDDNTAYKESWNILELYETRNDLPKLIIVGIEQGENRSDELLPWSFTYFDGNVVGGKADRYLTFLTTQLKPYIDSHFRTLKDPDHTGLMGSSFGGVNTLYAALKYDQYFTRFGCVSNAYLFDGFTKKIDQMLALKTFDTLNKFYLDVGTNEHSTKHYKALYVSKNKALAKTLKQKCSEDAFQFKLIEGGAHNERDWNKRFSDIVRFLFPN